MEYRPRVYSSYEGVEKVKLARYPFLTLRKNQIGPGNSPNAINSSESFYPLLSFSP